MLRQRQAAKPVSAPELPSAGLCKRLEDSTHQSVLQNQQMPWHAVNCRGHKRTMVSRILAKQLPGLGMWQFTGCFLVQQQGAGHA